MLTALLAAVLAAALQASPAAPPTAAKKKPVATPAPAVLEGLVKGPDGKPVENALVFGRSDRSDARTVATRTDAHGAFRLRFGRSSAVALWAQSPGLAPRKTDRVPLDRPVLISLAEGKILEGRVIDGTSGSPVPEAKVWALLDLAASMVFPEEPEAGRAVATTDARGRFRLGGLGPGLQTVSASARGYGRAVKESVRLDQRPELFLFPGPSISGAVAGIDGKPAPGAVVSASRVGRAWGARSERSDGLGRFEILGLEAGEYDVTATLDGAAPGIVRGVSLRDTDDERVTLSLESPVRLTGRLMSDPRHAVPGRVFVQELGGAAAPASLRETFESLAGSDGRFEIPGVPPGPLALGVVPTGFAARRLEVDVPYRPALDVGDVLVERGLTIRGLVRGPTGPVAGASLYAWSSNRSRGRATSEDDGSFVLSNLEIGTYSVSVQARGFASRTLPLDAGAADADILLDVAGSVSGEVTDRAGRPIESFNVTARSVDDVVESQGDTPSEGFAASDGRFTLENVPAGRWVVLVESFGHASATVPSVAVKSGATTALGRIRLGNGGTLKGTVTNPLGEGVPGATVAVTGERGYSFQGGIGPARTQSDANGQFEMTGLPPGQVDVSATHPAFARAYVSAIEIVPESGPAEVKLVLGQGGRIEGGARRRDGTPVVGARVRLISTGTNGRMAPSDFVEDTTATTDFEGRFALEHVPAGRARVTLFMGSSLMMTGRQDAQVDVRDGETATVDFVLRDILVSGTVSRSSGPASGLRVSARSARGSSYMSSASPDYVPAPAEGPQRGMGVTGEDGRYALIMDEVGPGQAWVETLDGGIRFTRQAVEFPDSDSFTLDFNLSGVPVTGTTVDKQTGAPVPYASVWASRKTGDGRTTVGSGRSDAAGRFQIEIDPGEYTLGAGIEGYATTEVPVSVGPSGSADVRLEMSKGGSISGRVLNAAGAGIPSIAVQATGSDGNGEVETESRPDGSFNLSNLSQTVYTVSAGSPLPGYAVASNVSPGGAPLVLTLQAAGRARILVRDADGAPVAGAYATLERSNGIVVSRFLGETSDPAGVLELAVPYGVADLRIGTRDASARVSVEVKEGETASATVVLEKAE